jgi:hypothetical protein
MIIAGGGVMELVLILLNFFFFVAAAVVAKETTRVELLISTKTIKDKTLQGQTLGDKKANRLVIVPD